MTFTAENLRMFFELLPVYESLPTLARQELASIRNPSETVTKYDYNGCFPALADAGFLQPAVGLPLISRRAVDIV